MTEMPVIHGYDYGAPPAAHSPITIDELRKLEQTIGWTKDDADAIAMAGEVLGGQEEAMVDNWRSVIGEHEHLAKWFRPRWET
jgi:Protoglobin